MQAKWKFFDEALFLLRIQQLVLLLYCPKGIMFYLGLPIFYPDGSAFGTICILDSKENQYNSHFKKLLEKFRNLFQKHIESQIYTSQLNDEINKRKIIENRLEETVEQRTQELQLAKERGFNNIRFLTCLFVRLLRCKNSCVASYAPVSTP